MSVFLYLEKHSISKLKTSWQVRRETTEERRFEFLCLLQHFFSCISDKGPRVYILHWASPSMQLALTTSQVSEHKSLSSAWPGKNQGLPTEDGSYPACRKQSSGLLPLGAETTRLQMQRRLKDSGTLHRPYCSGNKCDSRSNSGVAAFWYHQIITQGEKEGSTWWWWRERMHFSLTWRLHWVREHPWHLQRACQRPRTGPADWLWEQRPPAMPFPNFHLSRSFSALTALGNPLPPSLALRPQLSCSFWTPKPSTINPSPTWEMQSRLWEMGWHTWCHRESSKGTGNAEESAAALSHHRPGLPGHEETTGTWQSGTLYETTSWTAQMAPSKKTWKGNAWERTF